MGQVFTTQENGGLSTAQGSQDTFVEGNGSSIGIIGVNGIAELLGANGSHRTTLGYGNFAFWTGSGESFGFGSSDISSFADLEALGGSVRTLSGATLSGATEEQNALPTVVFTSYSQDP